MTATPLQLANAMCIIANRGYYYTPHFVQKLDEETDEDSALVNKYRRKHEVLTHISDDAYQTVIDGMQDVVTLGTARVALIPGIDVCAKTGTAENYTVLDGKRIKLPNNSMFVCFAPKENPKIAIAVAVQNAGFGATWAGPIARILMEKYLNDTIQEKSKADVERISATNLMPVYFKRLQFIEDSTRAHKWLETYKDSSYLKKYLSAKQKNYDKSPAKKNIPVSKDPRKELAAMLTDEKQFRRTITQSVL
jgi:penicillin-binding protein 2